MLLGLNHIQSIQDNPIKITGSKSETNRLLMLQALFKGFEILNPSNSDDGAVMKKALISSDELIDIHHAGTAMRFLTAYFSVQEGRETLLTGSARMQERPIKILVDALKSLGAKISYEKNEGYPPLRIRGQKITKDNVTLKANVSSQYISALMLIGPSLEKGLTIHLKGTITSVPYIKMTLSLLHQIGVTAHFEGQQITIKPFVGKTSVTEVTVESDWSSVSYFYSIVALSRKHNQKRVLRISSYKQESLQGDACLQELYKQLGVTSTFDGHELILSLTPDFELPNAVAMDLLNAPDIAQTIAVTCLGLGVGCTLTGLHTLKIKETDRLEAMAFAPLAFCTTLRIEDAGVVSKSYPDFWEDLKGLGFSFEIIG